MFFPPSKLRNIVSPEVATRLTTFFSRVSAQIKNTLWDFRRPSRGKSLVTRFPEWRKGSWVWIHSACAFARVIESVRLRKLWSVFLSTELVNRFKQAQQDAEGCTFRQRPVDASQTVRCPVQIEARSASFSGSEVLP